MLDTTKVEIRRKRMVLPVFLALALLGCASSRESADIARARELIERLRSFDIEERDEAMAALERLGGKAEPALREVVGDQDAEVAARARQLLNRMEIELSLSTTVWRKFRGPGIVRRDAPAQRAIRGCRSH